MKNDLAVIKKDIAVIKQRQNGTATKDDLKRFATKDDLKKYLSKDEYFQSADQIMGELKTIREEVTILVDMKRQVNDHEDRLEKVEEKLNLTF